MEKDKFENKQNLGSQSVDPLRCTTSCMSRIRVIDHVSGQIVRYPLEVLNSIVVNCRHNKIVFYWFDQEGQVFADAYDSSNVEIGVIYSGQKTTANTVEKFLRVNR